MGAIGKSHCRRLISAQATSQETRRGARPWCMFRRDLAPSPPGKHAARLAIFMLDTSRTGHRRDSAWRWRPARRPITQGCLGVSRGLHTRTIKTAAVRLPAPTTRETPNDASRTRIEARVAIQDTGADCSCHRADRLRRRWWRRFLSTDSPIVRRLALRQHAASGDAATGHAA